MPKISLLFASLHVLLMFALVVPIVLQRNRNKIGIGDGGDKLLARRLRVQGNFVEYVPLALLLMALLEVSGLPSAWLWGFGGALLASRLLHAQGLGSSAGYSFGRFTGTLVTWIVMLLMALAGIWLALR